MLGLLLVCLIAVTVLTKLSQNHTSSSICDNCNLELQRPLRSVYVKNWFVLRIDIVVWQPFLGHLKQVLMLPFFSIFFTSRMGNPQKAPFRYFVTQHRLCGAYKTFMFKVFQATVFGFYNFVKVPLFQLTRNHF